MHAVFSACVCSTCAFCVCCCILFALEGLSETNFEALHNLECARKEICIPLFRYSVILHFPVSHQGTLQS